MHRGALVVVPDREVPHGRRGDGEGDQDGEHPRPAAGGIPTRSDGGMRFHGGAEVRGRPKRPELRVNGVARPPLGPVYLISSATSGTVTAPLPPPPPPMPTARSCTSAW